MVLLGNETIEISTKDFEALVRDSEKVRVIEHLLQRQTYTTDQELRIVLELPDKPSSKDGMKGE